MQKIQAQALWKLLSDDPEHQVVDVREPDEFLAGHLPVAKCIPLSMLGQRISEIDLAREVTLVCQSGGRAGQAFSQLAELGAQSSRILEGGMSAWTKCGLPVRATRQVLPLQRQTMIGAGIVVLAGFMLGLLNPWFHVISAFAGTMLIAAGVTGFCFMAKVLQRMPWNRVNVEEPASCNSEGVVCHGA